MGSFILVGAGESVLASYLIVASKPTMRFGVWVFSRGMQIVGFGTN